MKKLIYLVFLFFVTSLFSQQVHTRTMTTKYKDTIVNYIILSNKGEENKKKPLFLFCQGSLARPLKIISEDASYPYLPFSENILLRKYHLVLISKPGIPNEVDVKNLQDDYTYPKIGLPPKEYILNNNLDYYYKRNNFIIKQLFKESWVDPEQTVVAGHSEGSYIALKMATSNKKITRLVYSGGNPLGRIMSIIHQTRQNPKEKENWNKEDLDFWKKTVLNKTRKEFNQENTSYYNYTLSQDFTPDLLKLKIPVLVTYGTKDQNGIFNDYLHILTIKEGKKNFLFRSFFNCDHNFFPIDENLNVNYEVDNWTKVANLWNDWLK